MKNIISVMLLGILLFGFEIPAFAGLGSYKKGAPDIIEVTFYIDQTSTSDPHETWKAYFEDAADAIWIYTHRQATLGKVEVYRKNNPSGVDIIAKGNGWAKARPYDRLLWWEKGLGGTDGIMSLPEKLSSVYGQRFGEVIAHEFGHYAFGVLDEYKLAVSRRWFLLERPFDYLNITTKEWDAFYEYDNAPMFGDLNALSPLGDEHGPTNSFRTSPKTIMDDVRYDSMSTPGNVYKKWDGSILLNGERVNVTFSTDQWHRKKESAWETMAGYRNIQYGKMGTASKPSLEWILMDGAPSTILALDDSGSMAGSKVNSVVTAAKNVIGRAWLASENYGLGDNVGAIRFASTASTLASCIEMKNQSVRAGHVNSIRLTGSGGTSFDAALNAALGQLMGRKTPADGEEVILLLSDGLSSVSSSTISALKARKVKVNTVAYGSDADENMLRYISRETGGKLTTVPLGATARSGSVKANLSEIDELGRFFSEIYTEARGCESIANISGVSDGKQANIHEVLVDSYTDMNLTFDLFWGDGDMDISVIQPNGTILDASSLGIKSQVDYGKADMSAFLRVESPAPGIWQVVVMPDKNGIASAYAVAISSFGRDNMRLYVTASGDALTYPEPLQIRAHFGGVVSGVTGAKVEGYVYCPDGKIVPFKLYDDGLHQDDEADDGIYANQFSSFTVDGEYRFVMTGNNATGQTTWAGYVPYRGGKLPEPEAVEPFSRQKSLTVHYDGVPEFINATRYTVTDFMSWKLDPNTGALMGDLLVYNCEDSAKTLMEPFWYAISETYNVQLAQVDGYTDDGNPYTDITDKVNAALMKEYGRLTMEPLEWVIINDVAVYSRDRSIPEMTALWSLWADPPGALEGRIDNYDRNANGLLDDEEILLAVEHWYANDMPDEEILRRIEVWKNGPLIQ